MKDYCDDDDFSGSKSGFFIELPGENELPPDYVILQEDGDENVILNGPTKITKTDSTHLLEFTIDIDNSGEIKYALDLEEGSSPPNSWKFRMKDCSGRPEGQEGSTGFKFTMPWPSDLNKLDVKTFEPVNNDEGNTVTKTLANAETNAETTCGAHQLRKEEGMIDLWMKPGCYLHVNGATTLTSVVRMEGDVDNFSTDKQAAFT